MFLKTGELKKIMKSSLKRYGLIVGNVNGHYLVALLNPMKPHMMRSNGKLKKKLILKSMSNGFNYCH